MEVVIITKSGKTRVLKVNSFEIMEKIANKFERWEYK
jgi:hypothetical protein